MKYYTINEEAAARAKEMDIKKLRVMCGMTQTEFSKTIGAPLRALRSWEQSGKNHRECKEWVFNLIVYYLTKEGYLE